MAQLIGIGVYAIVLGHLYGLNPTVATAVMAVTIAAALIRGSK